MNVYVQCKYIFLHLNIKFYFKIKFKENFEIWVCNNVSSIYVIYHFFVNQMLIYKKSSNDT
jgi:hypothetical protein